MPSERVFAIMRSCEGHLRHMFTEENMTAEVSAKCNDWILGELLKQQDESGQKFKFYPFLRYR